MLLNRFTLLGFLAIIALVLSPVIVSGQSAIDIAFYEDFSDGELDNSPTWSYVNMAWAIINGELHTDGTDLENDGRYRGVFNSFQTITTQGYLEYSYQAMSKSVGNPQPGRGVTLALGGGSYRYDLHIINTPLDGFHSFPTFALTYHVSGHEHYLITSSFAPAIDRMYEVKAIRQNGIWSLYVDGSLVGSAPDPIDLNTIEIVHMPTNGSVVVDNIVIKVESPNSPPDCANAYPSSEFLWPPQHQMEAVDILGVTDPDGDTVRIRVDSIFQDEPVNGLGDGDTSPDGIGTGTTTAWVRAERDGNGTGRFYHINFTAIDAVGANCTQTINVIISKSQSRKDVPVDEGALYNSTLP